MKKEKMAAALLLTGGLLAGCGRTTTAFVPTESCIRLATDKTVTQADVETFEKDSYRIEELKTYAEEAIQAFEDSDGFEGEGGAAVTECSLKDQTARLLIRFPNAQEYLAFNEEYPDEDDGMQISDLEILSVEEAKSAGKLPDVDFLKAKDLSKQVSVSEIEKQKNAYMAVVTGKAKIAAEGSIVYVSDGVTIENGLAVTQENQTSYIIFK